MVTYMYHNPENVKNRDLFLRRIRNMNFELLGDSRLASLFIYYLYLLEIQDSASSQEYLPVFNRVL